MFVNNGFVERLNDLLIQFNVSDYKIAQVTGIHASTIKNWKMGRTKPDNLKLEIVAKYLKVDKNWLATGEGNKLIISENPNSESIDVYSRLRELEARCNRYEEVIDTLTASMKSHTKVETVNLKQLFHDRDDKLDKMIKELEEKLLNYLRKDEKD